MKEIRKVLNAQYNLACEKICKAIAESGKPFVLTDSHLGLDSMYGYVYDADDSVLELNVKGLILKDHCLFVVLDLHNVRYEEQDLADLIGKVCESDNVYQIYDGKRFGGGEEMLYCSTIISILESIDEYLQMD